MSQKGFSNIAILVVAAILILGIGGYFVVTKKPETQPMPSANNQNNQPQNNSQANNQAEEIKIFHNDNPKFTFQYPSNFTIEKVGPNYNLISLEIGGEYIHGGPMVFLSVGVASPESIRSYNKGCESPEGSECYEFQPYNCEINSSTSCNEYVSRDGVTKRAVINNSKLHLRAEFYTGIGIDAAMAKSLGENINDINDEVVLELVKNGKISVYAQKNIELFNKVLSSFKFE